MKKLLIGLLALCSFTVLAQGHTEGYTDAQIKNELTSIGLSADSAKVVLREMKAQSPNGRLNISGVVKTRGFNAALFHDTNEENFDANIIDWETGKKKHYTIPATFSNGGLIISLGYRWVLCFLTEPVTLKELDGADFGRGVGISLDAAIGVELAFLPGKNIASDMFLVAPQIGAGGGVHFPEIVFQKGKLVK